MDILALFIVAGLTVFTLYKLIKKSNISKNNPSGGAGGSSSPVSDKENFTQEEL